MQPEPNNAPFPWTFATLEKLPLPAFTVNEQQRLQYVNEAFANMAPASQRSSQGMTLGELGLAPNGDGWSWLTSPDPSVPDFQPVSRAAAETLFIGQPKPAPCGQCPAIDDNDAKFQRLCEFSRFGVYLVQNDRFTYVSPRLAEITGFAVEQLLDMSPLDLMLPEDRALAAEHIRQRLEGEIEAANYRARLQTPAGKVVHVELFGSVYQHQGQPALVGSVMDVSEEVHKTETLKRQYLHDPLTGLPNQYALQEQLGDLPPSSPFTLYCFDLDDFKGINETYGREVGDWLLIAIAHRLQSQLPRDVVLARLGNDEFAVLRLGPCDELEATQFAETLSEILRPAFSLDHFKLYISISQGIALAPTHAEEPATVLNFANQAMHFAQENANGCAFIFDPEMEAKRCRNTLLAAELTQSINDGQIELVYQPILELATGELYKCEALARWTSAVQGPVSPEVFIPLIEQKGLITAFGHGVFQRVAQQVEQWRRQLDPRFQISLNTSPLQWQDPRFDTEQWLTFLADKGLPADAINLEITENLLLGVDHKVKQKLNQFKQHGGPISLDDFGTGYSSMAYLQSFDIDYLKIDRLFIHTLKPDSKEKVLCEAMITMAHQLGIRVVAEGVETAEQLALLKTLGCDFVQGFFVAPPMSADDLARFVQSSAHAAQHGTPTP